MSQNFILRNVDVKTFYMYTFVAFQHNIVKFRMFIYRLLQSIPKELLTSRQLRLSDGLVKMSPHKHP